MADRSYAPPPSARLARDDHEWVTKFARQEDISVQAAVDHAVWLLRWWQTKGKNAVTETLAAVDLMCCEYQKQSRQLHIMRRAYEKQLCRERNIRRGYEEQLRRQRGRYEQEEKVTVQSRNEAPYDPTVAKLLALAVCSDSDGEARAALEKARKLHRLAA